MKRNNKREKKGKESNNSSFEVSFEECAKETG